MAYVYLNHDEIRNFSIELFKHYGFSPEDSASIVDVLLCADLFGIESHGIQRLIRYHRSLKKGEVEIAARPEVVRETPVSAVVDAHRVMGHIAGAYAMNLAIQKAKISGIGMVAVRNSTHYGIAGYYTKMAVEQDLIGVCMTNTEPIMVPTFGRQHMLGTNPIAFAMPADPIPFWFDAATTVSPLGKMEVYTKRGQPLPTEWAIDAQGQEIRDSAEMIRTLRSGPYGGLLPLGGLGELHSGHKGYGLGLMVTICSAILSGGPVDPHMKDEKGDNTSHCFWAIDYGMFGDKAQLRAETGKLLEDMRQSELAEGAKRIYTPGEKAWASRIEKLKNGLPVQEQTVAEMVSIGEDLGIPFASYVRI